MNPEIMKYLGSLFVAAAVGLGFYGGRDYLRSAFDWVHDDLSDKLRRLRVPTRNLRKYLVGWLVAVAATFFGLAVVLQNLTFALLLGALMLAAPWYVVRRLAERRRRKIEDQLADAMVTMASAVKAGLSLPQSLEILAAQCPRPINAEFHQIVAEYKLGKTLERTLNEARARLRSENFALFAAALLASHESGGRLNETVERIARSVLEMQRLERKVISETAQARKSAVYMAIAPAFILLVYYFIEPVNTMLLFTRPVGQLLLGIALVFNVMAYLWARAILNPDI
jgi:tight adherence protein B